MRKYVVYGALSSAFLFLAACSSEISEDDFALEVVEEEHVQADERTAFDWLGLTDEEKETMVVGALKKAGYGRFPPDAIIASLDETYASTYDMSEDFETIFGFILNEFEGPQIARWSDQYGDDFFTESKNNNVVHIAEQEDTVFIVHGRGSLSSMFYSYAKEDSWQRRDIPLFLGEAGLGATEQDVFTRTTEHINSILQKEGLDPAVYDSFDDKLIYDNDRIYVLLRDTRINATDKNHVLLHFTLSEEGLVENGVTQGMPFDPTVLMTNKGKLALIIEERIGHTRTGTHNIVYLDDKDKQPIKTYEFSSAFGNRFDLSTNTVDRIYYYEDTGLMVIGDKDAYQLDTNTGEPVWNSSGQETPHDFNLRDSIGHFYTDNTLAIAYGKNNTFNVYDELLTPQGVGVQIPFDIDAKDFAPNFWLTSNETTYTVWRQHEFQGKAALQFVTIEKGIGAYAN